MTFKVEYIGDQKEEISDFTKKAHQYWKEYFSITSHWAVDLENNRALMMIRMGRTLEDCDDITWELLDNQDSHTFTTTTISDNNEYKNRTLTYKITGYHKNGKPSTPSNKDQKTIIEALSARGRKRMFDIDYYDTCKVTIIQ